MGWISYAVLILISLAGYSGGAVGRAGKNSERKPSLVDLVFILFIWGGAVYARLALDINKWFLVLLCGIFSAAIGMAVHSFKRLDVKTEKGPQDAEKVPAGTIKGLWERWKQFSKRMGSFQSRMILAFLFFLVVSPFALAVKVFSDPLKIKSRTSESFWVSREETTTDMESYRKQF